MLAKRIIPCLDVKNGETVKGTNFVNLRSAGDPVELGKMYSDQGADELVYLDITASHEGRKTFTDMVTRVAQEINIPFTVGGGINALEDVERTIHAVNLWEAREDTIGTYSGGMRQRALLAQAILGNPQIVIMDEPTVGLDPKERVNFRELVASIAEERTVIIATHIVSDLEKLASEIIFLSHGKIVESGTMEELLARYRETMEEPSVEKIYMRLNEGES